jgi:ubiquinone/menaquinone biosynthesis C-methylase UbiE
VKSSREYFSEVAPKWDELRSAFFSESVRDKAIALSGARRGMVAADIGAGTGFMSEGLVNLGLKVIAVDNSREMIAEAEKKLGLKDGVDFRIGAAENVPIGDNSVDCVFANMLLHHAESPDVVVKEMARIVRHGGKVVVTDLDRHENTFLRTEHHDRWMGFSGEDVKGFFIRAGLEDVRVVRLSEQCCATSTGGERAEVAIFAALGSKPAHKNIK